MIRGLSLTLLVCALSTAAMAAPSAIKPAPARASAPAGQLPAAARKITLSAEGRTIAARIMGAPDPRTTQIQAEVATIRQQKLAMITGPTVDVDKLEPLMRREEALQTEFRARQNDRLLVLLRALPDADRQALLQTLANPAKLPNAKPADPAN